ncbi:uncharacterized protein LOC124361473 [Homalodisca vitripennis]|uniref:uncharacterized protein LOC124361473 n=1 Tax=Homalodisca vitripennis TaxID=197043 RepID=UPI001EECC316|nr:uncharacterized protein LOC124361473 [Homalodisca vitripennis]
MFTLLLAILISSAARISYGAPGFQSSVDSGLGEGHTYSFTRPYYGSPYSYNTPSYNYGPQWPYDNSYGHERLFDYTYFPNQYISSYPNLMARSNQSKTKEEILMNSRKSRSPYTVFYETFQETSNADYPHYTVEEYYSEPFYFDDDEKDKYNNSEFFQEHENISSSEYDLNNNKTLNGTSSENIKEPMLSEGGGTPKISRDFVITYLGTVTPSDFLSVSHSPADDPPLGIPFYPLQIDNVNSNLGKGSAPPILVSPHTIESDTQLQDLYLKPYSAFSKKPANTFQESPIPYFSPVLMSVISEQPYKVSEFAEPQNQKDEYLLFDFQPVFKSSTVQQNDPHRLFSEQVLGSVKPVVPIVMKPKIHKVINTGAFHKFGVIEKGKKYKNYHNQKYDAGFETHLPKAYIYSKLHTDKGVATEIFEKKGEKTFSTGTDFKLGWF